MLRKYFLLSLSFFLIQKTVVFAQQKIRCGNTEYMTWRQAENQDFANQLLQNEVRIQNYSQQQSVHEVNAVVTIPVVFHILYKTTAENISLNRITDQVATLNKDFSRQNADTSNTPDAFRAVAANTNIQFCLAQRDPNDNPTSGILRVQVTATGYDPITNDHIKYTAQGGDDAWPRDKYLNIWVCTFNGNSSQILGISQLPGGPAATDGCCVLNTSIGGTTFHGTEANYDLGRTLTHEVGHWFGLLHVWGDDNGNCSGTDNVSDTPNQRSENYFCPTYPKTDLCTTISPGIMFMNYLDYVDDNCMNLFTAGQSTRMNAVINGFRALIKTSNGCLSPIGINEPAASIVQLHLFPNPTSGIFNISYLMNRPGNSTIEISNMIGQLVFEKEIKNISDLNLSVDLSNQSPGIYHLSVKTTDAIVARKIIFTR